MTCREKLKEMNPLFDEKTIEDIIKSYCPKEWKIPYPTKGRCCHTKCSECWEQEVPREGGLIIMKRFIVYLVRKRLGLKICEVFRFVGQKSDAAYFFTEDAVMKIWNGTIEKSGVSLNWLLDDNCEIRRVETMDAEVER